MIISRLQIHNFRQYRHLDMLLDPGVNIFLGENGQGKTNLLESIYAVAKGQSFRPGSSSYWLGPNQSSASVTAHIQKQVGFCHELKMVIEGNRKSFFIDDKKVARAGLIQKFPCVLFSPESLSVIKGSSEERRSLVDDFLASHASGATHLIEAHHRVLSSRNRLLRDIKKGLLTDQREIHRILDSMEPRFIETSLMLTRARLLAIKDLQGDIAAMIHRLFPERNVDISVDYLISGHSAKNWDDSQIEATFSERLKLLRNAEIDSGGSLVGPQKHDIQFYFRGQDARYFCSQGEQRSIILSFKLAQIMYHYRVHHEYPILLLDDVLSELDQERRTKLIETLREIKSQIIVTTTDLSLSWNLGGSDLAVFQVINGEIAEANY